MIVPLSYTHENLYSHAVKIAEKYEFSLISIEQASNKDFVLMLDDQGLSLHSFNDKNYSPVQIDFNQGKNYYRQHFSGGKNQLIAKAFGISQGIYPTILDATAGYGSDAYVLASLGCNVTMIENNPVMTALLAQALNMARDNPVVERMQLKHIDSIRYIQNMTAKGIDVIYLDPMFPEKSGTAKVKKNMQILHQIVGQPIREDELLHNALAKARYRVIVKRPKSAPFLAKTQPQHQLSSKNQRFDIYINESLQNIKSQT